MSHDQLASLVKMINQIADNVGRGDDADAVASHVVRFWAAPMKTRIVEHLQQGGDGLNPVARQAVQQLAG